MMHFLTSSVFMEMAVSVVDSIGVIVIDSWSFDK